MMRVIFKPGCACRQKFLWLICVSGLFVFLPQRLCSQISLRAASPNNLLVMIQGTVEVSRAGNGAWTRGQLNQALFPSDRLRTGERSRAEIYLANGMTIQKG